MKVLIADDSATSRILLRSTLQRWGYQVVVAENGEQALDILSGPDSPPMAILDWVMPFLTGPEVCQKIRGEAHREPYTYILLLTSKNTKNETVQGLDAGADDYIVKPFDEHELRVRLRAGKRIIDLQMDLLRAREELRERANKDLLTMLPNRHAVFAELERDLSLGFRPVEARVRRKRRHAGHEDERDVTAALGHLLRLGRRKRSRRIRGCPRRRQCPPR